MNPWFRRASLIGPLAFLTACQPVWVKPGESGGAFAAVANACITESRAGVFGGGVSGALNRQAFFDRCLIAHGYRQVAAGDVPANATGHPVVSPSGAYLEPHEAQ